MTHDPPSAISPIETDEPTRSDQLIELAKNSRRGRFSLRAMFRMLLLSSVGFALLRAMGILDRWEQYYWLFVGAGFFFAPTACLWLAAWLWPRPTGHYRVAAVGCIFMALVYAWSMLIFGDPETYFISVMIFGFILWGIQVACIGTVQWSVFRDNVPRRTLPERLPESDESG